MTDRSGERQGPVAPPGRGAGRARRALPRVRGRAHAAPRSRRSCTRPRGPSCRSSTTSRSRTWRSGASPSWGDAAFAVRPHAGAGTAKACEDAWKAPGRAPRRGRRPGGGPRALGAGPARPRPEPPRAYPGDGGPLAIPPYLDPGRPLASPRPLRPRPLIGVPPPRADAATRRRAPAIASNRLREVHEPRHRVTGARGRRARMETGEEARRLHHPAPSDLADGAVTRRKGPGVQTSIGELLSTAPGDCLELGKPGQEKWHRS